MALPGYLRGLPRPGVRSDAHEAGTGGPGRPVVTMTPDENALLMERRPELARAISHYAEWLLEMTREPGRFGRYEVIVQDSKVRTAHRTETDQLDG